MGRKIRAVHVQYCNMSKTPKMTSVNVGRLAQAVTINGILKHFAIQDGDT